SHGDDPEALGDFAWYNGNSGDKTHPVARKHPNPWGLYDMHGNVWEWCWDWHSAYSSAVVVYPRGPYKGSGRVLRGGSFGDSPERLRSAVRVGVVPEVGVRFNGFRCVRVPARQH
ncbi:MAG: formylglycine-generating enzyme family protein, partial [Sulfitobacter sp.]|nr:formylglycine-generating enzyme family protein [Sulfitobacter sp.]